MKILASDFDNTLHFRNERKEGYFKQEDLIAIERFQKNGNLFGLCTGRPLFGFEGDLAGGPDLDFIIASAGAVIAVKENSSFRPVFEERITPEDVNGLQKFFGKEADFYIHADGRMFTLETHKPQYPSQVVVPDAFALKDRTICCLSVWTESNAHAEDLAGRIVREFPGELAAYPNTNWIDVVHAGVSKGTGAKKALELFHGDQLAVIGDARNDLPMLTDVDISFSFHASEESVRSQAKFLIDSVAEAIGIFESL